MIDNDVSVYLPLVIKESLDLSFEFKVDVLIMIKMLQSSKESWQLVPLVVGRLVFFVLVNHLHEMSHDDWEYCDTHKQAKCNEETFSIRPWVVVSQTHGRQRGKWEVAKHNHGIHTPSTFRIDVIKSCEVLRLLQPCVIEIIPGKEFVLDLAEDFETHRKVVTAADYGNDDVNELESEWQCHHFSNACVVFIHMLSKSDRVALDVPI